MADKLNKTVLVIDDDDILQELMEAMLTRMGYTVLTASSGESAVKVAESYEENIDIAILDLFLPDIRGDKICPEIMKTNPGLKIVLMSGYGLKDKEVLSVEINAFIQKPCSYQELETALESLL